MSETFKCCNCGFECEIINSESLDMGIAECERCHMKGLRRQNSDVSFVDAFRKVIAMVDPQANSVMSKDMPPESVIIWFHVILLSCIARTGSRVLKSGQSYICYYVFVVVLFLFSAVLSFSRRWRVCRPAFLMQSALSP